MDNTNEINRVNLLENQSYDTNWADSYKLSSKLSTEVVTTVENTNMIAIVREYKDGSQQMLIDRQDGTVSVTNIVTSEGVEYTGPKAMQEDLNNNDRLTSARATSYLYDKNTENLLDSRFETGNPSSVVAMKNTTNLAASSATGMVGGGSSGGGINFLENQKWADGYKITDGFGAAIKDNAMDALKYNSSKLGQSYLELLNLQSQAKPLAGSLGKLNLGTHLSDKQANGKLSGAMSCINGLNDKMGDITGTFKNIVNEDYIAEHGNLEAFDKDSSETSADIVDEFGKHYSSYTDYLENYNTQVKTDTPGVFKYDINDSDYVPYYAKTTTMGISGGEFAKSTTVVTDDYVTSSAKLSVEDFDAYKNIGEAISKNITDGEYEGELKLSVDASYKYYSNGTTFEKYDGNGDVIHKESLTSNYGMFSGNGSISIGQKGLEAEGGLNFTLIDYDYKYADLKTHTTSDLDLRIAELYAQGGITIPLSGFSKVDRLSSGSKWTDIEEMTDGLNLSAKAGFNIVHLKGSGSFRIFGLDIGIDGDVPIGWDTEDGGLSNTITKALKGMEIKPVDFEEAYGDIVGNGKADKDMQDYINRHPSLGSTGNSSRDRSGPEYNPDNNWGLS